MKKKNTARNVVNLDNTKKKGRCAFCFRVLLFISGFFFLRFTKCEFDFIEFTGYLLPVLLGFFTDFTASVCLY